MNPRTYVESIFKNKSLWTGTINEFYRCLGHILRKTRTSTHLIALFFVIYCNTLVLYLATFWYRGC